MFNVTVNVGESIYEYIAQDSKNLLELLRDNGIAVASPCNGNGTCGKCKVKLTSENLPEALPAEVNLLGRQAVTEGYRLACNFAIQSDIKLSIDSDSSFVKIITEGRERTIDFLPIVSKTNPTLSKPDLSNQKADYERIFEYLNFTNNLDLELMRRIPEIIRENDYNLTLVTTSEDLLAVEAGDTTKALYGVAVDIGTTTIAAYLVDLSTGKRLCVNSLLNPQKIYGADVISRIKHTMDNEAGLDELHTLIVDAINACITIMCIQSHIEPADIYAVTLVGNTTMLHLLLKVCAKHIAAAPFIPAFTSKIKVQAKELGISINQFGIACVLPSVSAYIGADTVGAVLSTGMSEQNDISLLIDIGTNGELVLGNKDNLFACSSAAGPAFEGANIRNGMGSVSGAISSVSLTQGITFTTIADTKPMGICGTGIVDVLAQLLEVGIIDETGRIDMQWKTDIAAQAELGQRLSTVDGMNAFILCRASETMNGREIAVTQKDIRELQNAKAAIAAGIHVLIKQAGIDFGAIKNVYLAGGFGSYISNESALGIGLIPMELKGKLVAVGNAAGQGAIEALINTDCLTLADAISKKIKYIELSSSKIFSDYFIECMMF